MNSDAKHIPPEKLTDIAENRASATEVSEHLSTCADCAGELNMLTKVLANMRTDDSVDAPRDVLYNVINLFQPKTSIVRRLLAVLTFDSLSSAPAFGTRSGLSESRQLIYSAGDHDIDLHISTADNKWSVAGQFLGQAACGGGSLLLENDAYQVTSELSESCEFKVLDIPGGDYKLRLTLADLELEVPRLELRK